MDKNVFSDEIRDRVQGIHALSAQLNRIAGIPHRERLLGLMREHIDEIEALAAAGNPHYVVETGDLLILCLEILLDAGAGMDEITETCAGRYEKKLTALLEGVKRENIQG